MSKDGTIKEKVIALYKPPFNYRCGYIFDSDRHMVMDDDGVDTVARIRGWGRISYMKEPERLQDEAGKYIAELLTEHWGK